MLRKQFLVALISFLFCANTYAVTTSGDDANKVALGWLQKNPAPLGAKLKAKVGSVQTFRDGDGTTLYHVVALKPEGYVICSGDTGIEPILAFSAVGQYKSDPQNPLCVLVERDMRERLKIKRNPQTVRQTPSVAVKTGIRSDSESKWNSLRISTGNGFPATGSGLMSLNDLRVAPLIQSTWHQSTIWDGNSYQACYNYYTPPYEPGNPSNYVCGCSSTAWAQIMRYFRYPTQAVGTASFTISVDGVSATRNLRGGDGSGSPYLWSSMPLMPSASSSLQERQAIGNLCSDIGIVSATAYSAAGASAGLSISNLQNVFFYGSAKTHSGYGDEFHVAVRPNLDAKLPVVLGISGDGGHVLVCDGYGYNLASSYYHLNMGWGGDKDAWYNLPDVDADYNHFTIISGYSYNIYTNGVGEIISGRALETNGVPISNAVVYAVCGGQTNIATTDEKGIFALAGMPSDTTFFIRCEKSGYCFPLRTVTTGASSDSGNSGNKWSKDFIGIPDVGDCLVMGYVAGYNDTGLPGIQIEFGGLGSATTDGNGFYFKNVPLGWIGAVTPTGGVFDLFMPQSQSITNAQHEVVRFDFEGVYRIHVNQKASGSNDGSSWVNAYTNLQEAISLSPEGAEFWVAAGTYRPGSARSDSFSPKKCSTLYGGFGGTELQRAQRSCAHNSTVLSGDIGIAGDVLDNAYHVFVAADGVVLDGFTVTAGHVEAGYGGGVYGSDVVFRVANCIITSNSALYGGGVYYGTLYNCTLVGNSAFWGGGAYYSTLSNCTLVANSADSGGGACYGALNGCTLIDNSAVSNGGGVYCGTLCNCMLAGNSASQGGGAYQSTFYSCVLSSNWASWGGGTIWGTLYNCTLTGNSASNTGGGTYNSASCNCIVYNNSAGSEANWYAGSLSNSCTWPLPSSGTGNITNDPQFVDYSAGDLRLSPGSPCINAGSNQAWMVGAVDFDGNQRVSPAGSIVDIGAYEFHPDQPFICMTNSGSITITGYIGSGGVVTIPDTIDGLPVTSIGSNAFYNNASLTRITIASSVTNIGQASFGSCSNLAGVYFRGNAPGAGSDIFLNDDTTTVYYLASATGFGSTFGGRPTAIYEMEVISVTPLSLNFGSIVLGHSVTRNFTVQNTGIGTLSGSASVFAPFSILSGNNYNLTAGQRQVVVVCYQPTSAGSSTGSVSFTGGMGVMVQVSGSASAYATNVIQPWATGTFNGYVHGGWVATMTVTAKGKVTGKITTGGCSYTFAAASYAAGSNPVNGYSIVTTAKIGRTSLPLELLVEHQEIIGNDAGQLSVVTGTLGADKNIVMFRNVWKDADMLGVPAKVQGYYTATLPGGDSYGSGYLAFTLDTKGNVKTVGKMADGTAVSLSSTLLVEGPDTNLFVVIYSAPTAYKGGCLFGLASVGFDKILTAKAAGTDATFSWVNLNPQATETYGDGFDRSLDLVGGWYDKIGNLARYYTNTLTVGVGDTTAPTIIAGTESHEAICWNPDGQVLSIVTNNGVLKGIAAAKAGPPLKAEGVWTYASTNGMGLTIGLTRATGVYRGSFKAWFDYGNVHTSKSIPFEGILTPERADKTDGIEGRGFYLWPGKVTTPVTYTFKTSYDFLIQDGP